MSERPTLKSLGDRLDGVEARVATVREIDAEARALSKCAQALDDLTTRAGSSSVSSTAYGYSMAYNGGGPLAEGYGPVTRILNYLRHRHGLPDPAEEVKRLAAEVGPLRRRCAELEQRLSNVRGAAETTGGQW